MKSRFVELRFNKTRCKHLMSFPIITVMRNN